jgi:3-isopropylmalate dehydrogenase
MAQAERVLAAVARHEHFGYELVRFPHSAARLKATGELITDKTLEEMGQAEAVLFGAIGDPAVPEGDSLLTGVFERFDLGISIRPARLYADWMTPLAGAHGRRIDLVLVRDSTEDVFVAPGGTVRMGTANEISIGLLVYTRMAVERVSRYAFRLARARRRRLLLVSQSNAVPAHRIWNRTVDELSAEYPDVEVRTAYPDTAAQLFITDPYDLDVVLTTYWLGGIYTNLIGALVGGISVIASGRLNLDRHLGWFEPAHGSAPKYAGQNKVSPIGTFGALAMLLQFVGEGEAARLIDRAISEVLVAGRLPNVSARGPMGTAEATDCVLDTMEHPTGGGFDALPAILP